MDECYTATLAMHYTYYNQIGHLNEGFLLIPIILPDYGYLPKRERIELAVQAC